MRRTPAFAVSLASVLLLVSEARAQVFPNPPGVSLERFLPPPSENRILAVPTTQTLALLDVSLSLAADWAKAPLRIPDGDGVIANQVTAQALAALGLGRVELGVGFPVVLYQGTDYPQSLPSLRTVTQGDLRFVAKVRLTPKEGRVGVAVDATAQFPTGTGGHFASDGGFGFAGRLIADVRLGPVLVAGYAGYRYRTSPQALLNMYLADEVLAGLAVQVGLLRDQLDLFAEAWGSFGVRKDPATGAGREEEDFPAEGLLGLKVQLPAGLHASVAAGPGFTHGYGTPTVRVVAALAWTREARDNDGDGVDNRDDKCPTFAEDRDGFEDEDGCPDLDNDKDDVPDAKDKCPDQAEDRDGFEDDDGCPDPDNDKDGILDGADKCPNEAEDKDNQFDDDGCPDPDNDKDGIPDDADKCPTEAEDRDGYRDEDGCPEPDNDQDGIADLDDKCPNQPEDYDKFEDDDGCPEPDNDKDGFPDYKDRCPLRAETFNGFEDDDGCPESGHGPDLVRIAGGQIEIKQRIFFDTASAKLQSRSYKLLNTVAIVINLHKEITKVLIAGHTDSRGDPEKNRKLSQARAESVMHHLVDKGGVFPERLEAKGFGPDEPLLPDAHTASQHEVNRRVEFRILQ